MGGRKDKIMNKNSKINTYINQWYEWLIKEVKTNIAKDLMSEYAADLLHHVILDLYNLSDKKIDQMTNDDKLRWYILRGCALQLKSSTSPFYRLHRREKMQSRENYTHNHSEATSGIGILEQIYEPYKMPEWEECFHREWEKLHFYEKTLLERKFIQNWTFEELHKTYNISKVHLTKDINCAVIKLRKLCDC